MPTHSFRFRTTQPGIDSAHAFSAGPHYDPAYLSDGPVIGLDRHVVAPGHGFDWHAHAGVVIVSLVVSGVLRHEDADGAELLVPAGEQVLVQACGAGIRHRESAHGDEPLVFVQTTLLLDVRRAVYLAVPPVSFGGVVFGAGDYFVCGPVSIAMSENRERDEGSARIVEA